MNAVISSEQARQITKGRTPLVPVEYEEAVKALRACTQIDEAKYWSDKASALAAWAKIYHSDEVSRQARILRLYAYRRMGVLAQEIQKQNGGGRIRTILEDKGLSVTEARQIDGVGRATQKQFERAIAAPRPPAPWVFSRGNEVTELKPLRSMHTMTINTTPAQIASLIDGEARQTFRKMISEISEWLDALDQRLGKKS